MLYKLQKNYSLKINFLFLLFKQCVSFILTSYVSHLKVKLENVPIKYFAITMFLVLKNHKFVELNIKNSIINFFKNLR